MRDIKFPPSQDGSSNSGRPVQKPIISPESNKRFVQVTPNRNYYPPQKNTGKKFLFIGLFLTLFAIGLIFFVATFVFDGASISIKPLKKVESINETYIVSVEDKNTLLNEKELFITEEVTIRKTIQKNVTKKAEGEITVYNDFDSIPQKLLKGTRFSTADGKIFKTISDITVPGKVSGVKGSILAKVIAEIDGVEYNIGPTRFTIPGLKSSPKYKGFYGESTKTMKGGIAGKANEVAELALQKAKTDLTEKLKSSLKSQLGTLVPTGFTYNSDMIATELGRFEKSSEDDETATYSQVATGTTVYFKLDEIVKRVIQNQFGNSVNKPIVKINDIKDLKISANDLSFLLSIEDKPIPLTVTGPAPVTYYPNKESILEYYAGRNVSEFDEIAKKFQFIESASRSIRPLWTKTFPTNITKIQIDFDESL